jgi:hypothetical protein
MAEITLPAQTMFAELTQRCLDAEFDERYDERGRFKRRRKKGYLYWHYIRDVAGKEREEYVGPVRDPAINDRVKRFESIKSDFKARRQLVRALLAAGLPAPDSITGEVVEALWKAGFFRLRGVLIGTVAFQSYSGIMGTRLAGATMMTQDVDVAQFYDISHLVGDSMPPVLEVLRSVNASFRPVPDQFDPHRVSRFRTKEGYAVEFLTPNRGSDDHQGRPALMPALGGASATPLRYLDYLIHEPTRSLLLYKAGIPVTVPAPARYAVHKLIVAALRSQERAKAPKDVAQAEQLLRLLLPSRSFELFEVWEEAWERGPAWRTNLMKGTALLPERARNELLFSLETHGWTDGRKRTRSK